MKAHRFLYHYANQPHALLQTLKRRGIKPTFIRSESKEEVPGEYGEHISFFVDPVPVVVMGRVYGKDHPVWYPGSRLYEHRVSLSELGKFSYHFVETPEKVLMLFDDQIGDAEYWRRLNRINAEKAYIGNSLNQFTRVYDSFKGTTESRILRAPTYPHWERSRLKYAACVPHVMIYPAKGELMVDCVTQITIR